MPSRAAALSPSPDHPATPPRAGLLGHGALVAAALLACLALPRPGAAVLLVPLGSAPAATRLGWLAEAGMNPAGPGPLPGSLIVRAPARLPLAGLLGQALLPLAAPESLCTPREVRR